MAGIEEKDVLYFSPSNEALAHLPYMIALDKCAATLLSKCLALRLTPHQVHAEPAIVQSSTPFS